MNQELMIGWYTDGVDAVSQSIILFRADESTQTAPVLYIPLRRGIQGVVVRERVGTPFP